MNNKLRIAILLVLFLLLAAALVWSVLTFGYWIPLAAIAGTVLFFFLLRLWMVHRRLTYLKEKYQDDGVVEKIVSGTIWQGQTPEQLIDSLGKPHDTDEKVLKTKKKEIWKYQHEGRNRYKLRITLENDEVVGWNHR